MNVKFFSFIFLLNLHLASFGQSEFINSDHFGILAGGGYFTNNNIRGVGLNFGFSILGLVDFGVEHSSNSFDRKTYSSNFESTSSLVYFGYNIKRKNDSNNLKLLAGYLSSNDISGLAIGLVFSLRILDSKSFILLPSLGLLYGFLSVSDDNYFYGYRSNDSHLDNTRSIGFEFNIIPKLTDEVFFLITPSISKDLINSSNSLIVGIYGGVIISLPNSESIP